MSGLNLSQVRSLIVRPALQALGLWSLAAENLLMGTMLVESGGVYLQQAGGGPAVGLWQMEPVTHDDCWENWLCAPGRSRQATALRQMIGYLAPSAALMIWNLKYAAGMARIRYQRVSAPLPAADDAQALCAYWKTHYNTAGGGGAVNDNHIALFQAAIAA
ncbi:hypothetical protein [Gluconobacter albidus]|uniref:Phage tail lysozyme domain-containing protein n=1 Tax=Gluconobacter albidus TaxID=318683 RepID=A0AAW3QZ56_9PROT|nr:hypothetical protein [Gluconobacter albidus]KXV39454.1 hypothetical protein AD941_05000 [Gluconobacter albidus]MBS1029432.1 hypothetical protein [Gluconobacter albidus]GBQ91007.1 hypothetical protein AA3250_2193 [Gluconobacter albidus NBRC 3250]GLQ69338.1 hypothetical protein GCM10007866_17890 [Gluconobacter albidus]